MTVVGEASWHEHFGNAKLRAIAKADAAAAFAHAGTADLLRQRRIDRVDEHVDLVLLQHLDHDHAQVSRRFMV